MSMNPVNKYCASLHENIFEKLLGVLYIAKMKPALKVAEKMFDDPEFEAHLENIRYHNEQLEKFLKTYCKKNPNGRNCKGRST